MTLEELREKAKRNTTPTTSIRDETKTASSKSASNKTTVAKTASSSSSKKSSSSLAGLSLEELRERAKSNTTRTGTARTSSVSETWNSDKGTAGTSRKVSSERAEQLRRARERNAAKSSESMAGSSEARSGSSKEDNRFSGGSRTGLVGEKPEGPKEGFSAKKLVGGTVLKGADEFAASLTSSAAWLEGLFTKAAGELLGDTELYKSAPLYMLNQRMQSAKGQNQEYFQENVERGGKAAELVDRYGTATVAAIPQAALALATAGTSAAAQGTTAGLQAASSTAAATGALSSTVKTAVARLAKDPKYWASFAQVVGPSYDQAKADGASEFEANADAIANGLFNAAVEVGGGIETLPEELQKVGQSGIKTWIKSSLDEGKEEVIQGVLERGLQNLIYGKDNPLASVTDENAIFNPVTAAEEFTGGVIVGGILGGGQIAVDSALRRAVRGLNSRALDNRQGHTYIGDREGVSPAATPQVRALGEQQAVTQAADPDATVLDTYATYIMEQQGVPKKVAEKRAAVVQRLVNGDTSVTPKDLNVLEPTHPKTREVFSALTGVQFPEGKLSSEQLFNVYKSAGDAAIQARTQQEAELQAARDQADMQEAVTQAKTLADAAQVRQRAIQDEQLSSMQVNAETQDRIDDAVAALISKVDGLNIGPDGNPLPSLSDFAVRYKAVFPQATDAEVRQQYQTFRNDSQTLNFGGRNLTRQQFRDLIQTQSKAGAAMSNEQVDALFNQALLDSLGDDAALQLLGTAEEKSAAAEARKARQSEGRTRKSRNALKLDNGSEITRDQFKAFFKDYYAARGTETTDSSLDALFDVMLTKQDKGELMPYDSAMEKYLKGDAINGEAGGAVSVGAGLSGVSDVGPGQQGAGVSEGAGGAQAEGGERGDSRSAGHRGNAGVQPEAGRNGQAAEGGRNLAAQDEEVKVYEPQKRPNQEAAEKLQAKVKDSPKTVKKVKVEGLKEDASVLSRRLYTKEMRTVEKALMEKGYNLRVVMGRLRDLSGAAANGMVDLRSKTVYVQGDDFDYTVAQLSDHERFHVNAALDAKLRNAAWQRVVDEVSPSVSVEELDAQIAEQYGQSHGKVYKNSSNQQAIYREEFLADLNGGMNRIGLNQDVFDALSAVVRGASADWDTRWTAARRQKGIANAKAQDQAAKESSDSIGDRAFSVTTETPWAEQIDHLDEFGYDRALYIEETPNILAEVGLGDLPLCMTKAHASDIMHAKDSSNVHWHGLDADTVKRLPELLSKPAMVLDSWTNPGDIVVVLTETDADGLPLVATIRPNGHATVDGTKGPANFITSVYGRDNFSQQTGTASRNNFLYLALKNDSVLYWNKKRTEALAQNCRLRLPRTLQGVPSDTILRDHRGYVKENIPERLFSTNDYGEDVPQFDSWNKAFFYYENQSDGKLCFAEPPMPGGEAEFGIINTDGEFETLGTYPVTNEGLKQFNFEIEDHMETEANMLGLEVEEDDLDMPGDTSPVSDNPWTKQDPNMTNFDIRVQQQREGFTPTDTPDFKAWFHDDSGELTNPDGQPKIFFRGDPYSGATRARSWQNANSGGTFFTTKVNVASEYAEGATDTRTGRFGSPMDVIKGVGRGGNDSRTEWRAEYVKNWKGAQNYLSEYFTNYEGDGLVLEGYNPETGESVPFSKAKEFLLRTNVNDLETLNQTGQPFTDWRTLETFPKTKKGLERFNRELGDIIRQNGLGIRGFGKFYLSAGNTLVIDAGYHGYAEIPKSYIPESIVSRDGSAYQHINDLAKNAFAAGYDCVVVKNVFDDGGAQNQYIIRDSSQIKSVYNKGTWDKGDPDFKFSASRGLDDFMQSLESEYGEGAAQEMFQTMEQLERARDRAEQRAADAEAAQQAAEWMASAEVEAARQMERDRADRKLDRQRNAAQEKLRQQRAKDRAAKAEAVRSARLAEQMNAGRTWSERLRRHDERATAAMDRLRQDAARRQSELRSRHAEELGNTRLAERMNAGRTWSERVRRQADRVTAERERRAQDHKLASEDAKKAAQVLRRYQKGDTEKLSNGPVATLRDAYHAPTVSERVKSSADKLRTAGRSFYKTFINGTQAVDDFSKLQDTDANTAVLLRNAIASNATAQTIRQENLVGKDGSVLDEQSLEDVAICWQGSGKGRKYDDASQIIFQDYLLHRHNIDRMGFRDNARAALEEFEDNHSWLTSLDPREFSLLVADGNQTAAKYQTLIEDFQAAKNKPIFADKKGAPLSADYSRGMVEQYEQEYPWLKEKAETLYAWWDKFMREWVVGESLSLEEYETMHTLYPSYVPTYRKDKGGFASGVNTFGGTASTRKGARKATGGTSPVANIEDSFMRLMRQNVTNQRANAVLRSITDSAMLDEDGTFNGFAVFDWNDLTQGQRQALNGDGLEGALETKTDQVAAKSLQKEGNVYRVRSWNDGQQVSAIVSQELYEALDFAFNQKTGWFTRVGQVLTTPMKTAITGANPGFALRNVFRDNLTAQVNSMAVVNSISGIKFEKYFAQAVKEIAQNSDHWKQFQALGGTNATWYSNESGNYVESIKQRSRAELNPINKTVAALGFFGEKTESATRFAEYLATIDRMPGGDTYANRLVGIKNAAEVTVDFSRKGTLGKAFNAWIPYWNPAVQGIDKTLRTFFDQPTVAGKAKTLGRAALTTLPLDILLYAIYDALGRKDDWEELNDRTKDTYYCIPLPEEHKFLKIPKSRDWGQIIGNPIMRILQGLDGREDPFKNYFEVSIAPNFLWSTPLDALGISWARELESNEDFAGRAIVPSPYSDMAKGDQWNSDTSKYAKLIADLGNKFTEEDWLSPMQLDYIIDDYFGDFGSMFQRLFAIGGVDEGLSTEEQAKEVAEDLFGNWVADNRYSSATVSDYYDMLDKVSQEVAAERIQNPEGYQDTPLYKLNSALNASGSPSDAIKDLNSQVRDLPDGPEKDALKQQIIEHAREALDMYDAVMSGESTEPKLEMQYSKYGSRVSKELISLADYAEDYAFEPSTYKPTSYTDPKDKNKEYVLKGDDEAQEKYRELYDEQYASAMDETIRSSAYRSAAPEKRAELLEAARDTVAEQTKEEFLAWLAKNRKSTSKK